MTKRLFAKSESQQLRGSSTSSSSSGRGSGIIYILYYYIIYAFTLRITRRGLIL